MIRLATIFQNGMTLQPGCGAAVQYAQTGWCHPTLYSSARLPLCLAGGRRARPGKRITQAPLAECAQRCFASALTGLR